MNDADSLRIATRQAIEVACLDGRLGQVPIDGLVRDLHDALRRLAPEDRARRVALIDARLQA